MKTLFKIGEIADLFHLNVKTLRYYDEIDLVTAMVLASTYGIGMCISAGILLCWQGSIYGLTMLIGNFITDTMMCELGIVGGFLIAMSGLGILEIKDCKTLNFLPSLFIPPIWCLISAQI